MGISKSSAQSAAAWLTKCKLLTVIKATVTATPELRCSSSMAKAWINAGKPREDNLIGRQLALKKSRQTTSKITPLCHALGAIMQRGDTVYLFPPLCFA